MITNAKLKAPCILTMLLKGTPSSLIMWRHHVRSQHPSTPRASSQPKPYSTHNSPSSSRPPRFYVPQSLDGILSGALVRLPEEESRHATKTLRLKEGSNLEICDGKGTIALAEIASIDNKKGSALLRVSENAITLPPTESWQWTVAIACGSLKGGRADWLVEKCVELGCARFQPLLTVRSPVIRSSSGVSSNGKMNKYKQQNGRGTNNYGGNDAIEDDEYDANSPQGSNSGNSSNYNNNNNNGGGRENRWQRVATAAMKQCLRPRSMIIEPACSVDDLCREFIQKSDGCFVGIEGAPPIHTVGTAMFSSSIDSGRERQGVLIIGPEGDFTQDELDKMIDAGATGVGLGGLRLRAETAAIAMLSYVMVSA